MPLYCTFYSSTYLQETRDLAKKIFEAYGIRSLLLTTKATSETYLTKVPSEYTIVESLDKVESQLISEHYFLLFTNEVGGSNSKLKNAGKLNFPMNRIHSMGKMYSLENDLESFVIDLIKRYSNQDLYLYDYNQAKYLFAGANPPTIHCLKYSPVLPYLLDHLPPLFISWNFGNDICKKWTHLTDRLQLCTDKQEYQIIVNSSSVFYDKIIYFCMEPHGEKMYSKCLDFLKTYSGCLFLGTHDRHLNNAEWHVSSSLSALKTMKVQKVHKKALSVVVSSKNSDPGHIYRLALVQALDNTKDLPFVLDIYGRCESLNFRNYRGELPDQEKDLALFPYQYHLNVENHYLPNYITEKLYDSLVSECLTFYKGAQNWSTFFDPECLLELSGEVSKIPEDISLITRIIMDNTSYVSRLPSIQRNKQKILRQYSFEPRVIGILQMVSTVCYVYSQEMKDHLKAEGFKTIHMTSSSKIEESELKSICCRGLEQQSPVLLLTNNSTIIMNCFDLLCFAFMDDPTADLYVFQTNNMNANEIQGCLMPCGMEKVLKNIELKTYGIVCI